MNHALILILLPLAGCFLLGALPEPKSPPRIRLLAPGQYEVKAVFAGAQVHQAAVLLDALAKGEAERLGCASVSTAVTAAEEEVPPPKPGAPADAPPPEVQTTVVGTLTCAAHAASTADTELRERWLVPVSAPSGQTRSGGRRRRPVTCAAAVARG